MKENFNRLLKLVLVHEGGKVDDPRDPGGRTNQGVTQRTFDAYLSVRHQQHRDVFTLTDAERDEIYQIQYWNKTQSTSLPDGVDYVVFDAAVHSGPAQAAKWLQRAVGSNPDGVIGERTVAAVYASRNIADIINSVCDQRLTMMKRLPTWKTYGKGWTRRVEEVRRLALELAGGREITPSSRVEEAHSKAASKDAVPSPARAPGDIAIGVGTTLLTASPLGLAIAEATDTLRPLVSALPSVGYIVTGLTLVGVAAAAAGSLYRVWAARRTREIASDLGVENPEVIV